MLRDLNVGNGSINASFEGGAVHLLVDSLATQFVESGATNYLEMQFHSEATGPIVVTLQRINGKTPHQLRAEAERERDELLEALKRCKFDSLNMTLEDREFCRAAIARATGEQP